MGAVLRGGLSLALCGFSFWSHDIGGFKGEPSPELYIRDTQFGLLTSHSRYHGTTPREPWNYGDRAVAVYKKFAALRYSLVPYIYSYAERAARTGLPVMRPLVLEYQDDPAVHDIGTQFLLGEDLLVAPVLNDESRASVYLPAGEEWVDFWSGERYVGGQTLHLTDVPIDELPLFVREESILPRREPTQSIPEGTADRVTLETRLAEIGATSARFAFYDEDHDQMIDLEAALDSGRETLAFTVEEGDRTDIFEAEVTGPDVAPRAVTVNDDTLTRVDADPEPGEWVYDEDIGQVTVNFT